MIAFLFPESAVSKNNLRIKERSFIFANQFEFFHLLNQRGGVTCFLKGGIYA